MSQGNKYRAQILLEPEQHRRLAEIADRENRSVSEVVREAVSEYVVARTEENLRKEQLAGLEQIKRFHEEVLQRRAGKPVEIDATELIRRMREERDEEVLTRTGDNRLGRH